MSLVRIIIVIILSVLVGHNASSIRHRRRFNSVTSNYTKYVLFITYQVKSGVTNTDTIYNALLEEFASLKESTFVDYLIRYKHREVLPFISNIIETINGTDEDNNTAIEDIPESTDMVDITGDLL